jgi:hypothetical protein
VIPDELRARAGPSTKMPSDALDHFGERARVNSACLRRCCVSIPLPQLSPRARISFWTRDCRPSRTRSSSGVALDNDGITLVEDTAQQCAQSIDVIGKAISAFAHA